MSNELMMHLRATEIERLHGSRHRSRHRLERPEVMRYVVMTVSNDGNSAEICESFAEIGDTVRRMLDEPDSTGQGLDGQHREEMEADLASMTETYLPHVRGMSAWKEWAYIAPLTEKE